MFTFNKALVAGTALVTAGAASAGTPLFDGNEMIVPLTAVADAQYVTVTLSNVVAADGGTGGSGSVRIGFLAGDANSSRTVALADLIAVNAALTQFVTASNFQDDIDGSGTLSLSDLLQVNANQGHALAAP